MKCLSDIKQLYNNSYAKFIKDNSKNLDKVIGYIEECIVEATVDGYTNCTFSMHYLHNNSEYEEMYNFIYYNSKFCTKYICAILSKYGYHWEATTEFERLSYIKISGW